jgi:hypothetical protein
VRLRVDGKARQPAGLPVFWAEKMRAFADDGLGPDRHCAGMAGTGMGESYAALWRAPGEEIARGKVVVDRDALHVEGMTADGRVSRRHVPYAEIEGVRIARAPEERLNGRPTLIVERASAPALELDVLGAGMLFELSDLLAALTLERRERYERVTLIVPLKKNRIEQAQALIAAGPPFDPETKGLERHEVFLTDSEAVFLFEGPDAADVVQRLARNPAAWRAAMQWRPLLSGAPRLAHSAYSWRRQES